MLLISIVISLIVIVYAIKLYVNGTYKKFAENVDLKGKTVIVTGANAGIGKEIALELVNRNARVIMACRSKEKGLFALREIRSKCTATNYELLLMSLDLSSLDSVRSFAKEFLKCETKLDILINNAGVTGQKVISTQDGLVLTYATNYFGPFLLTQLLLDILKDSGPGSKIINVGSIAHTAADLNLDFLKPKKATFFIDNMQQSFIKRRPENVLYWNSKLMLLMSTVEIARRLENSGVTVNCVHPGVVRTSMIRQKSLFGYLVRMFLEIIARSPLDGCQPILHCALSPSLDGVTGKYFGNFEVEQRVHSMVKSKSACSKLYQLSEEMTGLA